jgi:dCTP deaminase
MVLLQDSEISKEIRENNLIIDPFEPSCVSPSAIKLRLGSPVFVLRATRDLVDIRDASSYPALDEVDTDGDGGLVIARERVYLVPTKEKVGFGPRLAGLVDGSSNLARLGIRVVLSGYVACGFGYSNPGVLTLELTSHAVPGVKLYAGMQICNLLVFRLPGRAQTLYGSNLWNHGGEARPVGSLLHLKPTAGEP